MVSQPKDPVTEVVHEATVAIEVASYTLAVVEGPDQGRSWTIDGRKPQRMILGQSGVCELKLDDARVSRRHAALESSGRRLRVTDLGSTNGTFVNGVQIGEALLQ